jgi:hypothetical protein
MIWRQLSSEVLGFRPNAKTQCHGKEDEEIESIQNELRKLYAEKKAARFPEPPRTYNP